MSNNNFDIVKKNIDEKIKILEKENNIYMEKLEEIKNRRNSMLFQQEKDLGILENTKKLKLKKFIKDLNNKENSLIIEEKMKKLQEDSKKVQLKMDIDLKKAINKKNEQIIKLEKENEQKIQKYRDEMREKERETIKRRGEIAKNQILSLKELASQQPPSTSYIYQINKDNFLEKEANLIINENKRRKEYMKHIDLKEFDELAKYYNEIKTKQINESNLKIKKERELWSQRSKAIPLYVNPLTKLVKEEEKKMKQEEEKKNKEKVKLKQIQINYKVPKPLIFIKEKFQSIDIGKKTKTLIKSSSYSDILRERMKRNFITSKNKKEKQEKDKKDTNQNLINFRLPLISLKEKNDKINKSFEKKKSNLKKNEIIREYLQQKRLINEEEREIKRNNGELSNLDHSKSNDIKKLMKENGMDENTLKIVKSKLEVLEEKKNQKSLLLKINGGIGNNPELGEEVCDLMIDAINAKLSIIQEIEDLDENKSP